MTTSSVNPLLLTDPVWMASQKVPQTFTSSKTGKEIGFQLFACWYNASYNQKNGYSSLDLKLKIGTCSYTHTFPDGNKDCLGWGYVNVGGKLGVAPQNLDQWKEVTKKSTRDVHVWLEDKDGNVYDYCWFLQKPLEGVSPKQLKKLNCYYKAASGVCEKYLWDVVGMKLKNDGMNILSEGKDYKTTMTLLNEAEDSRVLLLEVLLKKKLGDQMNTLKGDELIEKLDEISKEYFTPTISAGVFMEMKTKK